jgi:hypothetical protein
MSNERQKRSRQTNGIRGNNQSTKESIALRTAGSLSQLVNAQENEAKPNLVTNHTRYGVD